MSQGDNFEFDKLIGAVLVAGVAFVFSMNMGSILYPVKKFMVKRGYQVDVSNITAATAAASGIPDEIDIGQIFAEYDLDKGEQVFKKCAICHTNNKGGANKVGPNLWGILNAKVAVRTGFAYSNAMTSKGAAGDVWNYEELYRYLYSPKKYVPGTKMAFAGLKKDSDRVNLIMYLRSLADTPVAPPPKPINIAPVSGES